MLQADWPVHRTPEPRSHPSDLFEVLKGNNIMKAINADLVPIMIATEGPDFFDKNNVENIGPSEPMQNDQTCFFSNIF